MGRYRKKPVVIDALRFTGDNVHQVIDWMNAYGYMGHAHGHGPDDGWGDDGLFFIVTLEGEMRADPGDWIIREPFSTSDRQFYPCKPSIFEAMYEPVD